MRYLHATILLAVALLVMATSAGPAYAVERKVAVFDFELVDTSLEGEISGINPAETARLDMLAPHLRADIATEFDFVILDVAPLAAKAKERWLDDCKKCAIDLGRELGADIVITGTVQKVSNLILNINAHGYEVDTGKIVVQGSVDIRGNNDEMWDRGVAALWKNTLKKQFALLGAQ